MLLCISLPCSVFFILRTLTFSTNCIVLFIYGVFVCSFSIRSEVCIMKTKKKTKQKTPAYVKESSVFEYLYANIVVSSKYHERQTTTNSTFYVHIKHIKTSI